MSSKLQPSFLGFDFSTQQIKCICTDDQLRYLASYHVTFDSDCSEHGTEGGVKVSVDERSGRSRVSSPVMMWLQALDLLFSRIQEKVDFSQVQGLSGCGQMHGTVYWNRSSNETLKHLEPEKPLAPQLENCFALKNSPVWVDSSTTLECGEMELAVGGEDCMAQLTGSKAYERFCGPQIKYMHKYYPEVYEDTQRISIVSSFACSLFLGQIGPIDYGDGSGTNLMHIRNFCWDETLLDACAPGLREKLGPLVAPYERVGSISTYWSKRFGFPPNCAVAAFTGDNCASVEGLRAQNGDIAVSCGTSDNLILLGKDLKPNIYGHLFVSSIKSAPYFINLCYKNGSLAREELSRMFCDADWNKFEKTLSSTPVGNDGYIGLFYFKPEHIPQNGHGVYLFDPNNQKIENLSSERKVRALVEGQFLMKRVHLERLGGFSNVNRRPRILITGGASRNKSICEIIANVYGGDVYYSDSQDAAALGNAYRAKFCLNSENQYDSMFDSESSNQLWLVAKCDESAAKIYYSMVDRFADIEKQLFGEKI